MWKATSASKISISTQCNRVFCTTWHVTPHLLGEKFTSLRTWRLIPNFTPARTAIHIHPVYDLPLYLYKIHFNIVFKLPTGLLLDGLFSSALYTKTPHAFLLYPLHAIRSANLFLFDFTTLAVYGEEPRSWTFSCYFLPLGSMYSPHQSVFKHPQSMFSLDVSVYSCRK